MSGGSKRTYTCAICGETKEATGPGQKYCPDCIKKKRAESPQGPWTEPVFPPKPCRCCGKIIEHPTARQLICPECRIKHKEENKSRTSRIKNAESKKPKRAFDTAPELAAPEWSLHKKSADTVTVEARSLGLSYGLYVAYVTNGSIERQLHDRGIYDGLKRTQKAWAEHKKGRKR